MAHSEHILIQDIFEADDEKLLAYPVKPAFKDRIKNNIKKVSQSKSKIQALALRSQASKERANQDLISRFKLRT